jgi:hypothetical protein
VSLAEALAVIALVVWGIQAYVPWLGIRWNPFQRLLLITGGVLVALPPVLPQLTGTVRGTQVTLGAALALLAVLPALVRRLRPVAPDAA